MSCRKCDDGWICDGDCEWDLKDDKAYFKVCVHLAAGTYNVYVNDSCDVEVVTDPPPRSGWTLLGDLTLPEGDYRLHCKTKKNGEYKVKIKEAQNGCN